jgi:hypothetical protein
MVLDDVKWVSIVIIFHDSQRYTDLNKIGLQEKNSQSSKNPIPNNIFFEENY